MRESNEVLIALLSAAGLVVRGAPTGCCPGPGQISLQLGQISGNFRSENPSATPCTSGGQRDHRSRIESGEFLLLFRRRSSSGSGAPRRSSIFGSAAAAVE